MENRTFALLTLILLMTVTVAVRAQAPATMSFQGYLELAGAPADTSVSLTFRLLDDDTAVATVVWTETQPAVDVKKGIFNVVLGSVTPLSSLDFSQPLWLEIEDTVAGKAFTPRTELTGAPYALGLVLPQIHDVDIGGTALAINNISGYGIKGETQWSSGRGLVGQASSFVGQNDGVYGLSSSAEGTGVYGIANTSVATDPNYGVYGKSNSNTGFGVYGVAPKTGVYGTATADAVDAYGVKGQTSGSGLAVYGLSTGNGRGVYGHNTGTGRAGHFEINNASNSAEALFAYTNGTGSAGYFQIANGSNAANVLEATTSGSGYGLNAAGGAFGVRATSSAVTGVGVSGETAMSAGIGVRGLATATTSVTYGVLGQSDSESGQGVRGVGGFYGVYGEATTNGTSPSPTAGIYGKASSLGSNSYAGIFDGKVRILDQLDAEAFAHFYANVTIGNNLTVYGNADVSGDLTVTGTKDFRIDHPLDPANKYLFHHAIESDEVLNIYSGNVTTNEEGYAKVTLPDWFGALNKNFRYQLTVIGNFARAIIAEEISENHFAIRTDRPDTKVSWQVTGVRNDPNIRLHPPVVEADKPADEQGTYLSDAYQGGIQNSLVAEQSRQPQTQPRHVADDEQGRNHREE